MYELDYMQGDEVEDFKGTCALTSIANLLTQNNTPTSEVEVVNIAINNNWAVTDADAPSYTRGGSNYVEQQNILNSYGLSNDILHGYNPTAIANLIQSGRGVILALNAGYLWDDESHIGNKSVNHVVTVTGAVFKEEDNSLAGFYIADSGRGKVSDMTRYISLVKFEKVSKVKGAYSIYTNEPIKLWNENINAYGNESNNIIVGNRGDNQLFGYAGNDLLDGKNGNDYLNAGVGNDTLVGGKDNDTLLGGKGDDIYIFNKNDGIDIIFEDKNKGEDKVLFSNSVKKEDVLFFKKGDDLFIHYGKMDSIKVDSQFSTSSKIEKVELSNGNYLTNSDIEVLIQNMTSFANNNGIDITNRREVTNNSELINLVSNAWQVA